MSKNPKADKPPAPKTPAVVRTVEVTIYGEFPTPWEGNTAAEIKAMKEKRWNPGTVDFEAVAAVPNRGAKAERAQVFKVDSFGQMLGAMRDDPHTKKLRAPGTVRRVNIITHGTPSLFALSGKVTSDGNVLLNNTKGGTAGDDTGQMSGGIDIAALQMLNNEGKSLRDEIRSVFAPNAEIALFLCHGGVGPGALIMTDMAMVFNVAVFGYQDELHYQVSETKQHGIERAMTSKTAVGGYGLGYATTVKVPDERAGKHLLPFTAQKPRPKKPTP